MTTSRRSHLTPCLLILALTLFVYGNTFRNAFVWDDRVLIVENPFLMSWRHLPQLFVNNLYAPNGTSNFYRPLQAVTLLFDYTWSDGHPLGYHLTNTALHALNGMLVYGLSLAIGASQGAGLAAALLFAAHPVSTQAVTYVSGRADPLVAACMLGALLLAGAPTRRLPVAALAAFAAALLAKELAVIFPGLLVLVDRARPRPPVAVRTRLLRWSPFIALSLGYLLLRASGFVMLQDRDLVLLPGLGERIGTAARTIPVYLELFLAPHDLHFQRVLPELPGSLAAWHLLASCALLAALIVMAWCARRRLSALSFGVTWFLLTLLPVSNLVPVNYTLTEHWLYVPSVGLCHTVGVAVAAALRWARGRRGPATPIVLWTFAAALGLLAGAARARNRDWRDELTLYAHTAAHVPTSSRAFNNLGIAYCRQRDFDTAIQHFERAITLDRGNFEARMNLAQTYIELGRFDDADRVLNDALKDRPAWPKAFVLRGFLATRRGRPAEAIAPLREAMRLNPWDPYPYLELGRLAQEAGRPDEARHWWEEGLRRNPSAPTIRRSLEALDAERTHTPEAGRSQP